MAGEGIEICEVIGSEPGLCCQKRSFCSISEGGSEGVLIFCATSHSSTNHTSRVALCMPPPSFQTRYPPLSYPTILPLIATGAVLLLLSWGSSRTYTGQPYARRWLTLGTVVVKSS